MADGVAKFPPRGKAAEKGDEFTGQGVSLRPHSCELGAAGRQPTAIGQQAGGIWRGTVENATNAEDAAEQVAPLLAGTVRLDSCGVLATNSIAESSLRFLRTRGDQQPSRVLHGPETQFDLVGLRGQVLTHAGDLWIAPLNTGGFDILLRLRGLEHRFERKARGNTVRIAQRGPFGLTDECWEEVPMVELPCCLRLMMGDKCAGAGGAIVPADPAERFLVDEEEEIIVVNCWRRSPAASEEEGIDCTALKTDALELEQLIWHDTVASLAETTPCAEDPVHAERVQLADEGVVTRDELVTSSCESAQGVPPEDAARLGSLAFLRQSVKREVLEDEIMPFLMPDGGSTVRIFSAELQPAAVAAGGNTKSAAKLGGAPRPKTLDDLFNDDADFRVPAPWSSVAVDDDPLRQHELTSVFLLAERTGFLFAFHCLTTIDPCAV